MTWSKFFRFIAHFFAILATVLWMCSCNATGYSRVEYSKDLDHSYSRVVTGTRYTLGYFDFDLGAGEYLEAHTDPRPLLGVGLTYNRGMMELRASVDVLEPWQGTRDLTFHTSLEMTY